MSYEELQRGLEVVLGDGVVAKHTEEIEWSETIGTHTVFVVGSIVEGVDEEVPPVHVYLPCTSYDLDAAVKAVESEADFIWKNTHGCEECAKRNGWDFPGCAVDEDCPECGGDGVAI